MAKINLKSLRNINIYPWLRPLLFQLDAEKAHHLAITLLKKGCGPYVPNDEDAILRSIICGLHFPNPVGLAAGFDKNAEVMDECLAMGFGFVEVGSITPQPQAGNDKPRLFRIPKAGAVINRFGFNSDGIDKCYRRFIAYRDAHMREKRGVIGVNIGKNKTTVDAASDYVKGVKTFSRDADYITVNISSPNTPGLRDLQEREPMAALLRQVLATRDAAGKPTPIFVKIAPDQTEEQIDVIAEVVLETGVQGMIVGNTTVTRPKVIPPEIAKEAGGLSGRPLFDMSTQTLAAFYSRIGAKIPLIGCGGIASAQDAYTKIRHGASLVQLYTGLVYEGPLLVRDINRGLAALLERDGFKSVTEAVGVDVGRLG